MCHCVMMLMTYSFLFQYYLQNKTTMYFSLEFTVLKAAMLAVFMRVFWGIFAAT